MTRFLSLLALVSLLTGCSSGQSKSVVKQLTADEVKGYQAQSGKYLLLDVREPRELQEIGAVAGYVNIPLGQLEQRLSEVPKDKPVVTICKRGVRAAKAAEILSKNGYQTEGASGMLAWKEKNYPVVYPAQ